ncbi:MAG: amidohydrolase [Acinetobacter sp.]
MKNIRRDWSALAHEIDEILPEIISVRHHIHQYPELSNREFETSKLIAEKLQSYGIEIQTGIAGTGVVGVIKCDEDGLVQAYRAELDALPLTERTDLPYASKQKAIYAKADGTAEEVGVMHACGHDVHIAMVLGFAKFIAQHKSKFKGTFKFIFQPAEEGAPDGESGGARQMIQEGVLENPKPDICIGLHVTAGTFGEYRLGRHRTTASADTFKLEIIGKSTHAAFPWTGIDPVPLAAQIILAWQTIPSRQTDLSQSMPPVISVGRIYGGQRHNILADKIILEGTIRTISDSQRDFVLERMRSIAMHYADSLDASIDFSLSSNNYISGQNHTELVEHIVPILSELSDGKVIVDSGTYGTDDFAEYSRRIPSLFIRMGATPQHLYESGSYIWPTHSAQFVASDDAIKAGIKTFIYLSQHLSKFSFKGAL